MLSNRPYLLRAFYQWIVDSGCTPILVIDANDTRANVPSEFAEAGEIVLNISPSAVLDLKISNQHIEFRASFSGISHFINAPVGAILAVYAEENGEGLFLDAEDGELEEAPLVKKTALTAVGKSDRSTLRGIDGMNAEPLDGYAFDAPIPMPPRQKPVLKLVE